MLLEHKKWWCGVWCGECVHVQCSAVQCRAAQTMGISGYFPAVPSLTRHKVFIFVKTPLRDRARYSRGRPLPWEDSSHQKSRFSRSGGLLVCSYSSRPMTSILTLVFVSPFTTSTQNLLCSTFTGTEGGVVSVGRLEHVHRAAIC